MAQQPYLQGNNMALSSTSLKAKIATELENAGFVLTGEHAQSAAMAEAIANAVIDEIKSNGTVLVTGGSSSGSYKIT